MYATNRKKITQKHYNINNCGQRVRIEGDEKNEINSLVKVQHLNQNLLKFFGKMQNDAFF